MLKPYLTADIDHFWEAFDALSRCSTCNDSVTTIQKLYFDRATDGLIDFISVRDLTARSIATTDCTVSSSSMLQFARTRWL